MDLKALISKMTLKQKLAQLTQVNINCVLNKTGGSEITGPAMELGLSAEDVASMGSVLNFSGAGEMIKAQKEHLEADPNKIPMLFMMDVIHGYRTIYPIPLGMGATWDPKLLEVCCAMAAKEAATDGVHVTFGPMVDLVRDARWGRCMESTGEDVYLNSVMARAQVRGFQNGNEDKRYNLGACVKHFAAYGAAEAGRDYNTTDMSEHTLREYYLPAYRAAVDEGVEMVMTAFNLLGGIPTAGNKQLINGILRREWGFDKTVITDYHSFYEMKNHGYCADRAECAKVACETETDIEMMSTCFLREGAGHMSEEEIDRRVLRVLELKEKLGLLDDPYLMASEEAGDAMFLCDEHRELCRIAAERSAVLLKNDGVLPLSADVKKVAVIGPFAKGGMIGFWSCHGKADEAVSVYDGIAAHVGAENVSYAQGADTAVRAKPDFDMIGEAVEAAKNADCAVLCLGEGALMSGEGNSRADVALSDAQKTLVRAVSAVNKNTVVILFNGRPLALGDIIDDAPAFMTLWQPGTEGGSAAANLLFGKVNFEGRLTMSFPYHVGQCPIYYNRMMTGRPKPRDDKHYAYSSNYLDYPNSPLFPFGYGLSYTSFSVSEPTLSANEMTPDEAITATVSVKNTGSAAGVANVQLYVRDLAASYARPIRELKGYEKVELFPGEEKTVTFKITDDMLAFHTADGSFASEAGDFHVFVSENAEAGKPVAFKLVK